MFSVITNIYNKKIKGSTLMEFFTATGKLKKYFLTIRDVRFVHHGWHGTHRYDIQVLSIHASTWVHRYSSLMQWSVPFKHEQSERERERETNGHELLHLRHLMKIIHIITIPSDGSALYRGYTNKSNRSMTSTSAAQDQKGLEGNAALDSGKPTSLVV
jgi:hypothetical protein